MAGDRGNESKNDESLHGAEEQHASPETGHAAAPSRATEEKHGEKRKRLPVPKDRIRFSITTRRVRIDPNKKRNSYIKRLEKIMRQCDGIINDPSGFEELQLRAIGLQIQTIKVVYGLVLDIELETIEQEAKDLKKEEARIRREAGKKNHGYKLEDTPG
jgi:hypothetical protein